MSHLMSNLSWKEIEIVGAIKEGDRIDPIIRNVSHNELYKIVTHIRQLFRLQKKII